MTNHPSVKEKYRIRKLESALRELLDCGNAIVGADLGDASAQEAFDMYEEARKKARRSLLADI